MARPRAALGSLGRNSERFGMGSSESFGTPGSEPLGTRRSELDPDAAAAITVTGRPPVMTDTQLLELATRLNHSLGRPPKADELIAEAGGCQRKRALTAIQQLRQEIAVRSVRSQLLMPAAIEAYLRQLLSDWLQLAAEHLAQRQAEFSERQDERLAAAEAHAEDLKARMADLAKEADHQRKRAGEAQRQLDQLTAERNQTKAERDALRIVADERQRVIDQLVLGPATAAMAPPAVTA